MPEPLLNISDLCVDYVTDEGPVRAIDHLDLASHFHHRLAEAVDA